MTFDCMTPEELAGWMAAAMVYNHGRGNPVPCYDCPAWYHLAMKAEGRCDRVPLPTGRPIVPSEDPDVNAKREMWRRADRKRRKVAA